ncbi:ABC transporter substrate-binding protein [Acuticoccus sp. M5D2P5]|uniref:ABC transporter substrate-binding protein n=1 Tax=Acuticoccus kalidii TaxID=2910977 RepID=UPI001F2F4A39|nr:ABC transporter substrate-binding protein [Acuticoccus kalidii]MCF3934557.1 ABC transporter substrate-binding protein [Acuticoccus kalidii]
MNHPLHRLALAACTALVAVSSAHATDYPLTIVNCGVELRFDAPPERVVTVGQSATESLYSLGVGDTVVGTSVWFNAVLPDYAELDATIERLAENDPSFESIVNKRPDLVAVQYEWHVGPQGIVATRDQFHELGIATYVMPADCDTKDNTTGGDGTRTAAFSTDAVYKGLTELAAIFDAEDAGDALVSDLKARESAAIAKAEGLGLPGDTSAVFWFSSPDSQIDPYVAGRKGAPGYMMDKLGIHNVIESDEEWPTVGWESIARADPTIIVVAEMDRRRYPADDIEVKMDFLKTDPVAREMTAVRNGRIVVMDAHAMSATLRSILGLETVADALATLDLPR